MLFVFIGIVAFSRLLAGHHVYTRSEHDIETSLSHYSNNDHMKDSEWSLPSLHITSGLHPFEVDKLLWHEGFASFSNQFENAGVQLRGRGNSTWNHWAERRPFRLRFHEPRAMLESGYAHRDWIMLANSFDQTGMRNYFTLYLASLMGNTGFIPQSRFVHLYINDEYIGVYQLVDERDIGSGRFDFLIHSHPAVSEYLIEMDRRWDDAIDIMINDQVRPHDIRLPSGRQRTPDHDEYVRRYLYEVTEALESHDWVKINEVIDISSFVDFYIINELVQNLDVAWASSFMQIRGQGSDRRLYMGPPWDFDMTFGIRILEFYCNDDRPGSARTRSPEGTPWVSGFRRHLWYVELIQVPEFRTEVFIRWNEIRTNELEAAIYEAQRMILTYQYDFERSFLYQSFLSGPTGVVCIGDNEQFETYTEHVEFLFDFMDRRIAWLDDYFNSDEFLNGSAE